MDRDHHDIFMSVKGESVQWVFLCLRGHAHFIDPRIKAKYLHYRNLIEAVEARILRVRESEPRSSSVGSYPNVIVNPYYREVVTLDRTCNWADLMGTIMPVPTPRPVRPQVLLNWDILKWRREGIQIHLDDIQTLVYKDGLLTIESNQAAIDNLRSLDIEVEIIGLIHPIWVLSICPVEDEDLQIVDDMAEVTIDAPNKTPPLIIISDHSEE